MASGHNQLAAAHYPGWKPLWRSWRRREQSGRSHQSMACLFWQVWVEAIQKESCCFVTGPGHAGFCPTTQELVASPETLSFVCVKQERKTAVEQMLWEFWEATACKKPGLDFRETEITGSKWGQEWISETISWVSISPIRGQPSKSKRSLRRFAQL